MKEFIKGIIVIVGGIIVGIIELGIFIIIIHFFPNLDWILFILAILGIVFWFISVVGDFIKTKNIISLIRDVIFSFIIWFGIIVIVLIGCIGKMNIDTVVKKFNSVLVEESKHFAVYVSKKYIDDFSSDDKKKLQEAIEDIEKKYGSFISIYGKDSDNNKKISVIIYNGEIDKSLSRENVKAYVRIQIKRTIFFDINEFYVIRDTLLHELQHVCMANRINLFLWFFYSFTEERFGYVPAIYHSWFNECFSQSIYCFNHFFGGRVLYDKYKDKYEPQYRKFGNSKTSTPLMFYNWGDIENYNYSDNYSSAESFMKYLYIKSDYDINIFKDILSYANKYNGIDSILKVTEERFGIYDWGNLLTDWGYNSLEYYKSYTNTIREKDLKSYLSVSYKGDILSDKGDILKRGKKETVKLYSGMVMTVRDVFTFHENLVVKDCGEYKIIANKSKEYKNYIETDIIKDYQIIHIDKSDVKISIRGKVFRLKELPKGNGLKNIEGNKILVWRENIIGILKVTNGNLKVIEKIPAYEVYGQIKKDMVYKIIEENYNYDTYYYYE